MCNPHVKTVQTVHSLVKIYLLDIIWKGGVIVMVQNIIIKLRLSAYLS